MYRLKDVWVTQIVVRPAITWSIISMPDHLYATDNAAIEHLLSLGFTEIEAAHLVYMKDHVHEQVEYRELVEEERRFAFIRWLIETGRITS